jgi:hypothetical protein
MKGFNYMFKFITNLYEYFFSPWDTSIMEEGKESWFCQPYGTFSKEDERNTILKCDNHIILKISEKFYRPAEVDLLYGDSNETRLAIGWEPKISFEELVKRMTDWDINLLNVNLNNWTKGIYFVKYSNKNNNVKVKKFIIQ